MDEVFTISRVWNSDIITVPLMSIEVFFYKEQTRLLVLRIEKSCLT